MLRASLIGRSAKLMHRSNPRELKQSSHTNWLPRMARWRPLGALPSSIYFATCEQVSTNPTRPWVLQIMMLPIKPPRPTVPYAREEVQTPTLGREGSLKLRRRRLAQRFYRQFYLDETSDFGARGQERNLPAA